MEKKIKLSGQCARCGYVSDVMHDVNRYRVEDRTECDLNWHEFPDARHCPHGLPIEQIEDG